MADGQVTNAQQGFNDPYQYVTPGDVHVTGLQKFTDWFTGGYHQREANKNKAAYEQELERQRTNSARAFEEWFDSTAVQRRVKDIEKAGLNPWLALQSSGVQVNGSSNVSSSSAKTNFGGDGSANDVFRLFTTALMILKLLAK